MNRTALIIIWIMAVLAVCVSILVDIRESEGQEMIIPDGFDLWLDDDTVLAIPGGYIRRVVILGDFTNIGANQDIALPTVPSDQMAIITAAVIRARGTAPNSVAIALGRDGLTVEFVAFPAPVAGDWDSKMINVLLLPDDTLVARTVGGDATTDLDVRMVGYNWEGLGE